MGRNIRKSDEDTINEAMGAPVVSLPADATIAETLLAQAREVAVHIDDEANAGMNGEASKAVDEIRTALLEAVDAIDTCRTLQVKARSRVISEYSMRAAEIGVGVQRMKMSTQGSREEVEAAGERYRANAVEAMRSSVSDRFAVDAEKAGAAAADACIAVENALKRTRIAYAYRSTSASGKDLAAVLVQERFAKEIRDKGVARLLRVYGAAKDVGDQERMIELEDASESFLNDILTTPAARLAAKAINGRVNTSVDEEVATARTLLREFAVQREARMPRALHIAEQVMQTMIVPAFAATIGNRAWDLSRDEFDRLLRVDGARPFDKFDLRRNWINDLISGRPQPPAKSSQDAGVGGTSTIPGTRIEAAK